MPEAVPVVKIVTTAGLFKWGLCQLLERRSIVFLAQLILCLLHKIKFLNDIKAIHSKVYL